MKNLIKEIDGQIYLSYSFLIQSGISRSTVQDWQQRGVTSVFKDGLNAFIPLTDIPKRSIQKLPSESELKALLKEDKKDEQSENIYQQLKNAMSDSGDYRQYYRRTYGLSADEAIKAAMKRAVWDKLLFLYERKRNGKSVANGYLDAAFKAYKRIYPTSYTHKHSLIRAIKVAETGGVDAIIIDKRIYANSKKHTQKYDKRHFYMLHTLVSIGKAYKAPAIRDKMQTMCDEMGIATPSISWIKQQKALIVNQLEINEARFGAEQADKITPYASMKGALYADDQYQVDGWNLPFYYLGKNKQGNPRLSTLVLVAVKDAYSRKIVGYSIAKSENRLSLMEALEDAVKTTKALPFELVTDNHSYNETKEVGSFKSDTEKMGMTWTVDSNPKRKAIAERGFKDLGERFCKDHYGYIGQGIRTKDRDGRSKQELIDSYMKSGKILTEDEIVMIGVEVVLLFNKTVAKLHKKSPNQMYEESEKPNRVDVDFYQQLKIFTKCTEYKIRRGQINIEVAGKKHEYQLSAEHFHKYNNATVIVRYETLSCIYLFDIKTDVAICALKQKEKAHSALANQTPEDIEILNRNKGRLNGIRALARKEHEELTKEAEKLYPGIVELVNRRTAPKDVVKMAEEDEVYRRAVEERGINIGYVASVKKESELELASLKAPAQTKRERSPFAPKKSKISIIDENED